MGHDFSAVRVHTDAQAAASARSLDAAAIASGQHILFGSGTYAPEQPRGQALLAHELTHVVQHRQFGSAANARLLSNRNDVAERQADAMAFGVTAGLRAHPWSPAAPASMLSLVPATWYRGFAVGVPAVADGKVVHDLGGGVYFTDTQGVAQQYASLRSNGNQAVERVIGGTVDPHSLGPVLDLREEPQFMQVYTYLRKTGPVSGERYRPLVDATLKAKGKKLEDFAVIIGPEGIRDGTQMCIRDPQAATKVVTGMNPIAGGGAAPSGAGPGGGSGPSQPGGGSNPVQGAGAQPGAAGTPSDPLAVSGGKVSAMTPEDMYNKMIASRGFDEHVPAGKLDDVRAQLSQMEAELKTSPTPDLQRKYNRLLSQYNISTLESAGAPAGQGYNTYAIVQVVGPDGKIIAVAEGKFTGGLHAEQIALKKLDAQLGGQPVAIARIDVVSDKAVCPDVCVKAFEEFSEKYNVGKVDSYVFRRAKASGSGLASEKTTARTATSKFTEGMTPVKESKTIVSRNTGSATAPPAVGGGSPAGAGGPAAGQTGGQPGTAGTGGEANQAQVHPPGEGDRPTVVPKGVAGEGVAGADEAHGSARPGAGADVDAKPSAGAGAAAEHEPGATGARTAGKAEDEPGTPRVGGLAREGEVGESIMGGAAKSAVKGAAVSIGTGVALYILQSGFRDMVLNDLAALPQPQPDKRSALAYLGDPKTKGGMRALDVLTRNLGQFSQDLETEHAKISGSRFAQLMATAILPEKTTAQYEKKLQQLDSIQSALDAWEQELLTIDSNLDALLEMEGQLKQMAASAKSARAFFSMIGVGDELLKMGFEFDEYVDLLWILDNISKSVEITLRDAHKAKETVRRLIDETADFDHRVNKIWWDEFGGQFQQLVKDQNDAKRKAQEKSMQRTKARYGSLEGFEPMAAWNSDQLGMWYFYKTRESEILFQLNEQTKEAGHSLEAFQRKIELENELSSVRQKMLQMRSGAGAGAPTQ